MSNITEDPRIDPRIKALFGAMDLGSGDDVENREAILGQLVRLAFCC